MSNNELIDRYLNAIKLWLPRDQQDDILAELAEDLRAQIEDRESVLGHALDQNELADFLKQRGSPLRVASGYLRDDRLINPAMLPIYRMVLKIVLLWVILPILALMFIGPVFASANPGVAVLHFLDQAWRTSFFVIGMITTIFWLLDRYQSAWVDRWDPRRLPRVHRTNPQMQWYNDFAGFAFGIAAFIYWAVLMWHRSSFVFDTGFRIDLASIVGLLYWPILFLTLLRALLDLYCFLRPAWTAPRSWFRLALDAVSIVAPLLLLRVPVWIAVSGPTLSAADAAKLTLALNSMVQISLVVVPIITFIDVYRQARLLRRAKTGSSAPIHAASF